MLISRHHHCLLCYEFGILPYGRAVLSVPFISSFFASDAETPVLFIGCNPLLVLLLQCDPTQIWPVGTPSSWHLCSFDMSPPFFLKTFPYFPYRIISDPA